MGGEALKVLLLSDKTFHNNIRLLFHRSPVTYHRAFLFVLYKLFYFYSKNDEFMNDKRSGFCLRF